MSKKKKIVVLIALLLAGAIVAGILIWSNAKKTWYDVNATEFTITTADELYELAELSKEYDFAKQTIKLGADIIVNEGDAAKWGEDIPNRIWKPITGFAGTFDGQGHTISGLYGDGVVTSMGLFTDTKKSAVICDLQLVNSYFKNGNDKGTGSIIGFGGGTLDTVYSDAIVVGANQYVGGLIGKITVKAENMITNCWFDGSVTVKGVESINAGGLVGAIEVADAVNTIEHSLNTGEITSVSSQVGGFCGNVGKGSFLRLLDCMSSGTIHYSKDASSVGSVLGQLDSTSSVFFSDTYAVKEIKEDAIGNAAGDQSGKVITKTEELLTGYNGFQWTMLDFDNYWAVRVKGTPVLAHFAEEIPSLAGVAKKVDVSWYDSNKKEFVITTAEELYGLAYLSLTETFAAKTIKLGADIVVNEGKAEDWAEHPPTYEWTPIGWAGTKATSHFSGTFDGQGHSISGIYVKGSEKEAYLGLFGEIYRKGTVKNLILTNSYIESTRAKSEWGVVGSIAGRHLGTIDTVYSDAIVVGTGKFTGGLAGMITGESENTITNSWYAGKLRGAINTGGILGGVFGNNQNISATVSHCLNTGALTLTDGSSQAGGLVGVAQRGSTLYLSDSLSTGTIELDGTVKLIGTTMGIISKDSGGDSLVVFDGVYGLKETYKKNIGIISGVATGLCMNVDATTIKGNGAYKWTTLDFKNYWAAQKDSTPVLASFADSKLKVSGKRMIDTDWYNPEKDVYTLTTAEQLYGFAQISKSTSFEGKTVKLGADIVLNEGKATDWATNPPKNEWIPIGYQTTEVHFKGTFDGQGHTISGIYIKGNENELYLGLFGEIYRGATVKNLKIKNSYIEGNQKYELRGCTASLAGRIVEGNVESVYSEAIVVSTSKMTGGLIGMVTDDGNSRISDCWFAGELHSTTNTGGILGGVYGNKKVMCVTMENCLNTGIFYISDGSSQIGGLVGVVQQLGVLDLKDSFSAGTVEKDGTVKYIGAVIGCVAKNKDVGNSIARLERVYGIKEFGAKLVGVCDGEQVLKDSVALYEQNLSGYSGYRFMKLDFEKDWVIEAADATPYLRSYSGNKMMDMAGVKRADTSWYNENGKVFTITTSEQLYGFALLSNLYDFKGQTVKLGKDITINSGTAEELIEKPPVKNTWMPIGFQTGAEVHFKGTFDGQNYTISGAYKVGEKNENYIGFFGEIYRGATVKNLKLCNSYFEGNGDSKAAYWTGSVAGRMVEGTLSSVYSNAVVRNTAKMTGGLIGQIEDSGNSLVTNCWFDGTIHGAINTGGIVGAVYANGKEQLVTVEHCHNTGTLYISDGASQIGGLVGAVQQLGNLKLTDSLNAGTIETEGTVKLIGSAIGIVSYNNGVGNSYALLENVYGTKEFSASIIGQLNGDATETEASVVPVDNLKGYSGYHMTDLAYGTFWTIEDIASKPILTVFSSGDVLNTSSMVQADTSWYNVQSKEFTIDTAAELMGLSELSRKYDFEGQTIYLGQNIEFNKDVTAEAMMKNAPANWWIPIGSYADGTGPEFKGTFDGQGNTISGIYSVTNEQSHVGLFGTVGAGGKVKNLKLTESYFANSYQTGKNATNYAYMGSVAGVLYGTIDSVYSEATLNNASQYTGGIAGAILGSENGGEYIINNCWFAGTIDTASNKGGGIVGGINGNNKGIQVTISHCLNSGDITTSAIQQFGGICGIVMNKATLNLTDTLNTGTFTITNKTSYYIGSIIGFVNGTSDTVVANDVYGYASEDAWYNVVIGQNNGVLTQNGDIEVLSLDNLTGTKAYMNMNLDFCLNAADTEGYWIVTDKTPILSIFAGDTQVIDVATITEPRTAWYWSEQATTFEIETMADLYGLSELSADNSFKGVTINLTADITVNRDLYDKLDAGQVDGLLTWTPIGANNVGERQPFQGTFNGSGHTIAGLYATSDSQQWLGLFGTVGKGGTVFNLKLTESYFGNTHHTTANATNYAYMGSVTGVLYGTLDTIKSDVRLNNASQYTGGIAGVMLGTANDGEYVITNCWYDGETTIGSNKSGGIIGAVNGTMTATISHCLNSGNLLVTGSGDKKQLGGLCGITMGGPTVNISDSVNVGTIAKQSGSSVALSAHASLIGVVNGASDKVDMEHVYGYADSAMWVNRAIAIETGTVTGDYEVKGMEQLKGDNAKALQLDWYHQTSNPTGYWIVESNTATPILCELAGYTRERETAIEPDMSWYNTTDKDFHIDTAAELLGLSALSREYDFSGQNIYLDADIVLNNKTVEQMKNKAPLNVWTPIGFYAEGTGPEFKGTFNGQGNTISGLYLVMNEQSRVGLFGTVGKGGTVFNLKLTESYFGNTYQTTANATNYAYMGSVAGVLYGTIDSVYSEVTLNNASQYTGGIAGVMLGAANDGEYNIKNCWYAGETTIGSNKSGGIIGAVNGTMTATISHCLNSGSLLVTGSGDKKQLGGICGITMGGTTVNISDSVNVGTIAKQSGSSVTLSAHASLVGVVNGTSDQVDMKHVYGYADSEMWANRAIAIENGIVTGDYEVKGLEQLKGDNAKALALEWYDSASNADGHWTLNSKEQPVLYGFKEFFWRPEEE